MEVNMTEIPMEEKEMKFSKFFDIEFGGHWKPKDCRPRWKVDFYSCGLMKLTISAPVNLSFIEITRTD